MNSNIEIPVMADLFQKGEEADVLLWIGCAGSYDDRYKKVTKTFVKLLHHCKVKFAVLGPEESCTGDPARRAGNEFLFQMQAMANIQILNGYNVKKIVTACPHCFNTIKNEYPELGGNYEVYHHTQFIEMLVKEGKLDIAPIDGVQDLSITYHDSCYLGRANDEYEAPRNLLKMLTSDLREMERNRSNGLCCGAGGAQMFKEPEPGNKDINIERTEEALRTGANVIAAACPFCMTMMSDGVKNKEKESEVQVLDIVELIAKGKKL